jgi:hypothetical protein
MKAANAFNDRDCKEGALHAAAQRLEFRKLARRLERVEGVDPSGSAIDPNVAHIAGS